MRAARLIPLLAGAAVLLAGCGGGSKSTSTNSSGSSADGKQVFASAGCGSCHALQAAGSTGTIGPDLDQLKPTRDQVVQQVKSGGGGMPSFAGKLSGSEIDAVAAFVSGSATSNTMPAIVTFKPNKLAAGQLQDRRLDVLSPGLRQLLLPRGAEEGARAPPSEDGHRLGHRNDLPPHRPLDRRGRAPALPRQRRQGVRTRRPDLRLGVLPRPPAVEARRRHARQGRERRAQRLLRARRSARTRTTTTSACTVSATG